MWNADEDGRTALLKEGSPSGGRAATGGGMFQEYAAEFIRLRSVASARIQAIREANAAAPGREELRAAEKAIDEMESNRRQVQVQLRLELSSSAGTAKQEWEQRLQEWSKEVKSLRDQLEGLNEATSRRALNLDYGGGSSTSAAERRLAMQSTEMLERSSAKLEEAKRQAFESEAIGEGVMSDLSAQRETILHVRDSMRTIGTELTQARRSLDRMIQMAQRNRVQTLAIAAVLLLGLAFWALCVLGLPLKWTLLLAVAVIFLGAGVIAVRRRLATGSWQ
ncbi:unnamed protein product [Polarella glacialis]|uniref:Vesicle transport v-SNARE N-terminal domain-containing protein n=1 Tax=Polarella glacialis TaxID=89957 RepID=A0A813GCB3_POLGL|nr:unnamed protein product [Polarella glacialis]